MRPTDQSRAADRRAYAPATRAAAAAIVRDLRAYVAREFASPLARALELRAHASNLAECRLPIETAPRLAARVLRRA